MSSKPRTLAGLTWRRGSCPIEKRDRDRAKSPGRRALEQVGRSLVDLRRRSGRQSRARCGRRAPCEAVGAERPAFHQHLTDQRRGPSRATRRFDYVPVCETELDDDVAESPPLVRVAGRRNDRGLSGVAKGALVPSLTLPLWRGAPGMKGSSAASGAWPGVGLHDGMVVSSRRTPSSWIDARARAGGPGP